MNTLLVTRQSPLLTSEYGFTLQTINIFIASNEVVSATYFQVQITLQTNMFIASDQHACAGDEHFWR